MAHFDLKAAPAILGLTIPQTARNQAAQTRTQQNIMMPMGRSMRTGEQLLQLYTAICLDKSRPSTIP